MTEQKKVEGTKCLKPAYIETKPGIVITAVAGQFFRVSRWTAGASGLNFDFGVRVAHWRESPYQDNTWLKICRLGQRDWGKIVRASHWHWFHHSVAKICINQFLMLLFDSCSPPLKVGLCTQSNDELVISQQQIPHISRIFLRSFSVMDLATFGKPNHFAGHYWSFLFFFLLHFIGSLCNLTTWPPTTQISECTH